MIINTKEGEMPEDFLKRVRELAPPLSPKPTAEFLQAVFEAQQAARKKMEMEKKSDGDP